MESSKTRQKGKGIRVLLVVLLVLIVAVTGFVVYSFEEIVNYGDRFVAQQARPFSADEFNPRRVLEAQPTITEFPLKTVQEAKDLLNPSELVLAVTVGDEARAYPINMLTGPSREIINDKLGGKLIAATW